MRRATVLREVAARLDRDFGHPLRVGVDGVCGVGKTRFTAELADELRARGRTVIRLDSDGFHHLRAIRYRQGRESARGYYEDAYDLQGLREHVLLPLGPGGNRRYATALMDMESDRAVLASEEAVMDAVVLFDATFLQRGDLRDDWDEVVFLDAPADVAEARGVARDAAALGGADAARQAYAMRYSAACAIYLAEEQPAARASILIDHTDPQDPHIVR